MSWTTTQDAVLNAVSKCLKLSGKNAVAWFGQVDRTSWTQGKTCDLSVRSVTTRGTDELRYEFQQGDAVENSMLVPSVVGYRLFTVNAFLESDSQLHGAAAVTELASRLRTRLRRPDILAILQEAGVALVRIHESYSADYVDMDGRQMSASSTDIRFACTEVDTDDLNETGGGWVAEAQGDGLLEDPSGVEKPADFDTAST